MIYLSTARNPGHNLVHLSPERTILTDLSRSREVENMTRMDRIDRFIRRWHRKAWSVATLPDELGAIVGYLPSRWRMLGCCDVRRHQSVIALNGALLGTAYLIPVLAHECAHVLIGLRGYHGCGRDQDEHDVWSLAARLAIPRATTDAIRGGEMCSQYSARSLELPRAFVLFAAHGEPFLPAWLAELRTL